MAHVIPVALGGVAILSLAVVGLSSEHDPSPARVAFELGYTPEIAALAGLSPQQASSAMSSLAAADSLRDRLRDSNLALDAAQDAYSAANNAVRGGLISAERLAALAVADHNLSEAREERETAANLLRTLLTAGRDDDHLERMANCLASAAYSVPLEYRVMGYSDDAWEEIAGAVRQARRIEAGVFDPADADLSAIASLDDNPLVVEAKARLDANLQSIQQVFTGFEEES